MNIRSLLVGNGAGPIKTFADLMTACKGAQNRVTVGSATLLRRDGNIPATVEGTFYIHPTEHWALNALGLPNIGMATWEGELPSMVALAHKHGKKLSFSVAGFSPAEYAEMTRRAFAYKVDAVQLNLSCKNVWDGGRNKAIAAKNPALVEEILHGVSNVLPSNLLGYDIEVKVSPDDDLTLVSDLCEVFATSGVVKRLIVGNTKGGQRRPRPDGTEALAFCAEENGLVVHEGGLSGSALTEHTPKMVELYRNRLPSSVGIIACGGIFTGSDAWKSVKRGAEGIETTTGYFMHGPRIFGDIYTELADLMPQAA